jgi:hypothetical protein
MTPLPVSTAESTTISLNPTLSHSITYNPTTDTITAHLPTPTVLEKTPNKPKLMLLIYFASRDFSRKSQPRKLDAEISLDIHIVERIIRQFSNRDQALRTLKEYAQVGEEIDTSNGMEPNRTAPGADGATKAIRMVITKEVKEVLVEWFEEILDPQVLFHRKG